ncbi:MAG0130/MAG3770 family membrane protein [Mycoplasma sp. HS2188]|uniref:MAG0130/MAG3770 family membrane protein n=1 Tax=Mycoplasma sp. HS2188 TaxID=2976765 RepID=UPI0021AAAA80|nr:hypothetical protein [Mycoplasma sp. HS2188]MCT4469882.1 hypothetical protein [Mycoplasma sp. HS2188]
MDKLIQFQKLNIPQSKIDIFIKRANNKFWNIFWVICAILLVIAFVLLFALKSLIQTNILIISLSVLAVMLLFNSLVLNYIRTCLLFKKITQPIKKIWPKLKPNLFSLQWDLWWGISFHNLLYRRAKITKPERKKITEFFQQIQ